MFDWRDYLELAHALGGTHGPTPALRLSEATSRCAVSRAYYGAFCHARNYAQQHLGYVALNSPSDHGAVRRHYRLRGQNEIADSLDLLRAWRNQCDYRDRVRGIQVIVAKALAEADFIVSRL